MPPPRCFFSFLTCVVSAKIVQSVENCSILQSEKNPEDVDQTSHAWLSVRPLWIFDAPAVAHDRCRDLVERSNGRCLLVERLRMHFVLLTEARTLPFIKIGALTVSRSFDGGPPLQGSS